MKMEINLIFSPSEVVLNYSALGVFFFFLLLLATENSTHLPCSFFFLTLFIACGNALILMYIILGFNIGV